MHRFKDMRDFNNTIIIPFMMTMQNQNFGERRKKSEILSIKVSIRQYISYQVNIDGYKLNFMQDNFLFKSQLKHIADIRLQFTSVKFVYCSELLSEPLLLNFGLYAILYSFFCFVYSTFKYCVFQGLCFPISIC